MMFRMTNESDLIDDLIELLARDADLLTRRAANGEMNLREWEQAMRQLIREGINGASMLARGGTPYPNIVARTTAWLGRQREMAEQFIWLRRFARDIRRGRYDRDSLIGQVAARARMYANRMRTVWGKTRARVAQLTGMTQKRRVLSVAEHCPDCLEQAALGWVDINDSRVTNIGVGVQCMGNDKCTIEYR